MAQTSGLILTMFSFHLSLNLVSSAVLVYFTATALCAHYLLWEVFHFSKAKIGFCSASVNPLKSDVGLQFLYDY